VFSPAVNGLFPYAASFAALSAAHIQYAMLALYSVYLQAGKMSTWKNARTPSRRVLACLSIKPVL
jgi:hypothetical protein